MIYTGFLIRFIYLKIIQRYLIEKNIITRRKELMNLKILSIDVENDKIVITI
jgi:hypothetical protein